MYSDQIHPSPQVSMPCMTCVPVVLPVPRAYTALCTCTVTVSGIKILSMGDGFSRRNRFILSCALALGLGVTMVPQVSQERHII